MKDLIIQLSRWNTGLDQLTSRLDQDSTRRRLRALLSTSDTTELRELEAAANLLQHRDIQLMASARLVIEQGYLSEQPDHPLTSTKPPPYSKIDPTGTRQSPEYSLKIDQLKFRGKLYATDQVRTMAQYGEESVIVDWRCCQDDSWRKENPEAFRRRTENLTRILNSDLKPLDLSILHCVGYLNQSHNVTGYAFRLPAGAQPGQAPMTLHDLLKRIERPEKARDLPDLGERFALAKALANTIFNIHNLGWVHKNIQPKNILFWPKADNRDEPDLSKPYLMGFDISRPNAPGEASEKPLSHFEDDLYRHPHYKGMYARSFQPSFDIYSLGVVLYEIGMWRNVAYQRSSKSSDVRRPSLPTHNSDPQLVERMVEQGTIMAMKQYTGAKYRDAVKSCLSRDFDNLWEQKTGERQSQLQAYLGRLQTQVVDKLALCNA